MLKALIPNDKTIGDIIFKKLLSQGKCFDAYDLENYYDIKREKNKSFILVMKGFMYIAKQFFDSGKERDNFLRILLQYFLQVGDKVILFTEEDQETFTSIPEIREHYKLLYENNEMLEESKTVGKGSMPIRVMRIPKKIAIYEKVREQENYFSSDMQKSVISGITIFDDVTTDNQENKRKILLSIAKEAHRELVKQVPQGKTRIIVDENIFNRGDLERDITGWPLGAGIKNVAARNITKEDIQNKESSSTYTILHFFLKIHGATNPDRYIKELAEDNLTFLINHNLSFMPIEPWSETIQYYLIGIEYVAGAA